MMSIVIFRKADGKNGYTKIGDCTVKNAKELVEALGYKTVYAGSFRNEKTMDAIYNNGALYENFMYLPQVTA